MQARALELVRRMDEFPPLLELGIWSLYIYYRMRAEYPLARELAERVVRQGERQESLELLAMGYQMMASDFACQGRFRLALESSERALACMRSGLEQNWKLTVAGAGYEPSGDSCAFGRDEPFGLGAAGAGPAVRPGGSGAGPAHRPSPHTTALVLTYTALACQLRREVQEASRCAEEAVAISGERSYWCWQAWARVIQGWTLAELGQPREGLELIRQEIARWRGSGARFMMTYFLGVLAEVHLKLGQLARGTGGGARGTG